MKVMPIRFVADMSTATSFYAALGLAGGDESRSGNWIELGGAAGILALHAAGTSDQDQPGLVELSFVAGEPLEKIAERLASAGFHPGAILDESFGRSLRVTDPGGVPVQVNEHDRTLYT